MYFICRLASRHCCTANSTLVKFRVDTRVTQSAISISFRDVSLLHVIPRVI